MSGSGLIIETYQRIVISDTTSSVILEVSESGMVSVINEYELDNISPEVQAAVGRKLLEVVPTS